MAQERTLAIRETGELTPEEFVAGIAAARLKAQTLRDIVDQRGLSKAFGQSQHLMVEGWQVLARGYGLWGKSAIISHVRDAATGILTVQARCELITNDGVVVAGAESFCDSAEAGHEHQSLAQIAAMAQTRAFSRACRENLSWVAELAGYSPTPVEEMGGIVPTRQSDPDYWCAEHKTEWFKRGKMRNWAHPVEGMEGTGAWCNMPVDKPEKQAPQRRRKVIEGSVVPPAGEAPERLEPLKTPGDLLTRALRTHGLQRAEVLRVLNVGSPMMIDNLDEAWKTIEEVQAPLTTAAPEADLLEEEDPHG